MSEIANTDVDSFDFARNENALRKECVLLKEEIGLLKKKGECIRSLVKKIKLEHCKNEILRRAPSEYIC